MVKSNPIKKIIVASIFLMLMPFAFAALTLTGTIDEKAKSSKYSLKNISHYSQKSFSLSLLRTHLQNKSTLSINRNSLKNNSNFNSFIYFDNGNTTYVMPYKLTIKAPKFKTPSPNY